MYQHPIKDPYVLNQIKDKVYMLKKVVNIGTLKNIPHKPIGRRLRVSKKYRQRIEDYHQLSENYNVLKEINILSLTILIDILEQIIVMVPVKRY